MSLWRLRREYPPRGAASVPRRISSRPARPTTTTTTTMAVRRGPEYRPDSSRPGLVGCGLLGVGGHRRRKPRSGRARPSGASRAACPSGATAALARPFGSRRPPPPACGQRAAHNSRRSTAVAFGEGSRLQPICGPPKCPLPRHRGQSQQRKGGSFPLTGGGGGEADDAVVGRAWVVPSLFLHSRI